MTRWLMEAHVAAFSLGNRAAAPVAVLFAVPRHLIVDGVGPHRLAARFEAAFAGGVQP